MGITPLIATPVGVALTKKGCIHLGFLNIFIDFFKWITFIKFDRFLKIFVNFCKVSKCINVFNKLLF